LALVLFDLPLAQHTQMIQNFKPYDL
jgi:hypothetical protein